MKYQKLLILLKLIPQPVTVPEDNIKDNDLNLTLAETEKTTDLNTENSRADY